MAAEGVSIQRELAALREGQASLAQQLELTRRELREDIRELRDDFRGLRAEVVSVRNGQRAFASATVAGLLGVIATVIVKL